MEKIGFIGLGIMGKPMSIHLLKSGYEVTVLSSSASADALAKEGAKLASSPVELAKECDIVITCLPDSPEVESIVLGNEGVIEGLSTGNMFIDMSTISPSTTAIINQAMTKLGVEALDAPVSGGDGVPFQQVFRLWLVAHNQPLIGHYLYLKRWGKILF